jgi:pimeloyl-ACP methyl ester carboxylesterase
VGRLAPASAYERVGDGPPLVLVHGAAVDSRMWRPPLAALPGMAADNEAVREFCRAHSPRAR